jgi:hypothetical protein
MPWRIVMKSTAQLSLALVTFALLRSCSAAAPGTSGPAAGAAAEAAPGVPGTTFTVSSKNGGYPARLEFKEVKAAVASYGLGGLDKSNLAIYLGNTDLASVNLGAPKLSAGQGIVKLKLSRPGQKELTAGTYKPSGQYDADMRAAADIVVANGTTVQFNDHKMEGTIEVTELTADSISGTYDLKDPWSHVSGTFKAKIVK